MVLHTSNYFPPLHCRWMIERDRPTVFAIEDATGGEWTPDDLNHCLRQRNCIGMIVEAGEKVVGFMVYELQKTRLDLLKLAVQPSWQRRGVARVMLAKLIGKVCGCGHRRNKIRVTVGERNLPAQMALKAMGFRAVDILSDGERDDDYRFEFTVPSTADQAVEESARSS